MVMIVDIGLVGRTAPGTANLRHILSVKKSLPTHKKYRISKYAHTAEGDKEEFFHD